jgi:hypothetical protein
MLTKKIIRRGDNVDKKNCIRRGDNVDKKNCIRRGDNNRIHRFQENTSRLPYSCS